METAKIYDLSLQGFETYLFVLGEIPQPWSDPPIVRMARSAKTPGDQERYIGAESVRTIRRD